MIKLVLVVLFSTLVACSKSDADPSRSDDATESKGSERSESKSKRKDADEESKSERTASEGDPSDGIAPCDDWKKKLSSCEVLKKTAPSLIEKTAVVWRKKNMSRSDIERDCKAKTESLPKPCR